MSSTVSPRRRREFARRLWARDPGLFARARGEREAVLGRLDWLAAPGETLAGAEALESFAAGAKAEGLRTAVILGMGGSSLCPLVLSKVFRPAAGSLRLEVADTTSPGTVARLMAELDPAATLYVVSSKSGTTIEPNSLYALLRERAARLARLADPGRHFAAVTDPGTPLEELARREGFRGVFTAPPGVGGRYSALTVFGMLPAALMGLPVREILRRAADMARACGPDAPPGENPGVALGAWMAGQALAGRDKLTLLAAPGMEPMSLWLEQLLAESTGKKGKGVIPVAGEPDLDPALYGRDRAFVLLSGGLDERRGLLEGLGHPVLEAAVASPLDLGAEFFRWEVATAALGHFLGVNPFDEPNVAESKRNTSAILDERAATGRFPGEAGGVPAGSFTLHPPGGGHGGAPASVFSSFLDRARPGDYLAVLAYLPYGGDVEDSVLRLRRDAAARKGLATTFGYGPRYLHSTGQVHKGGPATGLFLMLTEREAQRLPVPGAAWTLGELHLAQALGDEIALRGRGRPVLRVHLEAGSRGLPEAVRALLGE